MKIGQDIRAQEIETKHARTSVGENKSFNHLIQSQTYQLKQQEIQQIMNQITLQGEKLSRFHSIQNVVKFKRLVKGFLEKIVDNGLHLHESHQFNSEGSSRKLAIVKEVDEKLIDLTEEVMNQEKEPVNLLGIIGEIKGLLINLYT